MECYFPPETPAWIVPLFRKLHKYHEELHCGEDPDDDGFCTSWIWRGSSGNRVFVAGISWSGGSSLERYRYRVPRRKVAEAQREFPLDALDNHA